MTDLPTPFELSQLRHTGALRLLRLIAVVAVGAMVFFAADRPGGSSLHPPAAGGSGEVTVDEKATPLVVNQAPVPAKLYPGGPPHVLSGTFTNSGTAPVAVADVTATLGTVAGGRGSCGGDSFVLVGPVMAVDQKISVGAEVGSWGGATIRMLDTPRNQDGCRAADIQILYTVR